MKARNSALELLRLLSMLMIMLLHYLNGSMGGALAHAEPGSFAFYSAYFGEAACIVGPNCFVLLSGYFLVERRATSLRRIAELYVDMVFYALAIYGLMRLFAPGLISPGVTWRRLLAPFLTGDRWFVKAYMLLYLLAPFLGAGLRALSRKGYRALLLVLLCAFTLWSSFLPGSPITDGGYGILNFMILYAVAGYIRLHGAPRARCGALLAVYFGCAAVSAACEIWTPLPGFSYSFVANMAGSVSLFLCFLRLPMRPRAWINRLASHAFGVFLIHADISIGYFLYYVLLRTSLFWNSPLLLPAAAVSVCAVYLACAVIDRARQLLFSKTVSPLLRRIRFLNAPIDPVAE